MKRYLVLLLFFLGLGELSAQERIEALRVAFITQRLELTPTEAQQFWPIYNEFKQKMDDRERPRGKRKDNLSTKEAEELIEKGLQAEEEKVKLKREYYDKLKKVISPQKILALHQAERDFKHELIGKMREERGHRGGGHKAGGGFKPHDRD